MTSADKREFEDVEHELDRRHGITDDERRNAREHRNGPGASDADIAAVAGLNGFPSNRTESREERVFTEYLRTGRAGEELRAAGEATGGAGGYMVPQSFWARMSVALKMYGGISSDFQQVPTDDGRVMPWPTNNPTTTLATYLTENTQVSNVNYVFGQGMLFAWTLTTGAILASLQLIQDSAIDVDQFVADRVGEQIGRKLAAEAVSGLGAASKAGTGIIPSLNAFGTASTGTGGVFDLGTATAVKTFTNPSSGGTELNQNVLSPQTCFSMIESVDPAYWDGAKFYLNPVQATNMRQIVDSNGRPLINFDDAFADGAIGSIGGFPVMCVPEIPNLAASTVGGPIFGNMQHAMVQRMVAGAEVMRLTERYADFLQVGFIGYQRFDFQPNDLRAAVTVFPRLPDSELARWLLILFTIPSTFRLHSLAWPMRLVSPMMARRPRLARRLLPGCLLACR